MHVPLVSPKNRRTIYQEHRYSKYLGKLETKDIKVNVDSANSKSFQPLVSVVLPVYNGSNYILDAINSIKNQTYTNWELLILDDGSSDQTFEIARSASLQEPRIIVKRHAPNRGLAFTMNQLVVRARGKYIAVQEHDDISMPDRLEKEVSLLENHLEIGLVSGIADWIDTNGNLITKFPGLLVKGRQFPQDRSKMISLLYIEQSKIVNAACMFRRSVLDEIEGPFDEMAKISIDWQFFLHLAHRHLIWGIPETLIKARRDSSHDHLTKGKQLQFKEARRCIKKIYNEYKTNPDSPINYTLYRKSMSYELTLEGRYYGRINGMAKFAAALLYDPSNKRVYQSIGEFTARGIKKSIRRISN